MANPKESLIGSIQISIHKVLEKVDFAKSQGAEGKSRFTQKPLNMAETKLEEAILWLSKVEEENMELNN